MEKKYTSIWSKFETALHQLEEIDKVYEDETQDIELDLEQNNNSGTVGSDKEVLSDDFDIDTNDDEVFFY